MTFGWYLPVPLLPRLAAAAALALWGGWTDRRWTVPVAVTLALPVVWLNSLAILAALVPLTGPIHRDQPGSQARNFGAVTARTGSVDSTP